MKQQLPDPTTQSPVSSETCPVLDTGRQALAPDLMVDAIIKDAIEYSGGRVQRGRTGRRYDSRGREAHPCDSAVSTISITNRDTEPPSPCRRLSRPRSTVGFSLPWGSPPLGNPVFHHHSTYRAPLGWFVRSLIHRHRQSTIVRRFAALSPQSLARMNKAECRLLDW